MKKIKSILLIDDDPVNNFLNQRTIEEANIAETVLIASNGREGIQKVLFNCSAVNQYCPELILLDCNMPVMDGKKFMESFSGLEFNKRQEVVIVLLTASINPMDIAPFYEFGIKDFLTKPINKEAFIKIYMKYFNI